MSKPNTLPKPKYVDLPEVTESFVDSFHRIVFDGETFRIEMCAKRMDDPKPPSPPSFKQYPVVRVVMPPSAAVELFNQMNRLIGAMGQAGIVKQEPVVPGPAVN